MLEKIYNKCINYICEEMIKESNKRYVSHTIEGIPFYCPDHYLAHIQKLLISLKSADREGFEIISNQLRFVYSVGKTRGLGSHRGITFMSSNATTEDLAEEPWVALAGYLVFMAHLNRSIESGKKWALMCWKSSRRRAAEAEKLTNIRLRNYLHQETDSLRALG